MRNGTLFSDWCSDPGCIGTWIVRNLIDRGNEVFVYDLDLASVRCNGIGGTFVPCRTIIGMMSDE